MGKLKGTIVVLIVSLLILGAAFPYIAWERLKTRELDVFILDKTVADNSYRDIEDLFMLSIIISMVKQI